MSETDPGSPSGQVPGDPDAESSETSAERTVPAELGGWRTRNLVVLSGVSFLQDTASELAYPILPVFLTSVLGAPVAVVGVVEGAAEGAASVTKLAAGWLGDRFPRRPLIAAGYGLATVGKALVALAAMWPVVMVGRVVDRLGKGIRGAPRDALLVEGIPVAARGRAFGVHRTADTLGAVVGPLLGLAAYHALGQRIRPLLLVAVVPAVLSVLLVAAVRQPSEGAGPSVVRGPRVVARCGGPAGGQPLPRRHWRVVAVLAAFSLLNFPDALLLLRLGELGFAVLLLATPAVRWSR